MSGKSTASGVFGEGFVGGFDRRTWEPASHIAYSSLPGTLSLCKDAAVLTHQSTVRKCRRLCQGPEDYYMLYAMPAPTVYRKVQFALEKFRYIKSQK